MSDESEERGLEARVRELEATVDTLTSELVDATERIRELEAALDEDEDRGDEESWVPAAEAVGDDADSSSGSEEGDGDRTADDIIVA
ncbi:MAG: hypothetical protein ABEJ77_01000 [Halanaeroarchaeum sp.]